MDNWMYSHKGDVGQIVCRDHDGVLLLCQEIQFQHGVVGPQPNGVRNEDVLALLTLRLQELNEALPCRENAMALMHLISARLWLEERTRHRTAQGVEGTTRAHQSSC